MTSINKSIDLIRERVVLDHTKRKWVRIISRNISERLPAEKVKEAEEFYRPYFKLNPCFHEFYAGKPGNLMSDIFQTICGMGSLTTTLTIKRWLQYLIISAFIRVSLGIFVSKQGILPIG